MEEEKAINFINLVSQGLCDLETLLVSMEAIIGDSGNEIENHLLNLIDMAKKSSKMIWRQLDKYVDGKKTAREVYDELEMQLK